MQRREFVIAAGTASLVGLAGCSGDGDTGSPDSVVEAYFTADDADEASDYVHPDSPFADMESEDGGDEENDFEFESAETQSEDIDMSYLEDEELGPGMEESAFTSVVEEEDVAHVVATVSVDGEEADQHVITATNDGDWLVLTFATDMSDMNMNN